MRQVLVTSNGNTIVRKQDKHKRTIPYTTRWMTNKINVERSYQIVAENMGSRVIHEENRARVITDALIVHRQNRIAYKLAAYNERIEKQLKAHDAIFGHGD